MTTQQEMRLIREALDAGNVPEETFCGGGAVSSRVEWLIKRNTVLEERRKEHILRAASRGSAAKRDSVRLLESLEWAVRQLDSEDEAELENGGDCLHRDAAGYKLCKAALAAARKAKP